MSNIVSLKELKRQHAMEQVQVRLPLEIRTQARDLAIKQSSPDRKIKEADVYRTAILLFLNQVSTDSRDNTKEVITIP